jgi:hypothetical protein
MFTAGRGSVVDQVDAHGGVVTETVDGAVLTDRQKEFARKVGAGSGLSGSLGSVFLYRQDAACSVRWQISPAGHPVTVDFLF